MIVYHVAKSKDCYEKIVQDNIITPGRNVATKQVEGVHLSLDPFLPGSWALDVIGTDTNEAWILEVEIPDDTPLTPDPSGEGALYRGRWVVHSGALRVIIVSATHIPNVQEWESRSMPT